MQAQNQARKTILVADDEAMVRSILKLILARGGYQITEAVDGEDAVCQFTQAPEQYDLVLLDMQMPRLDGQQALQRMRQIAPQLKAILLSGAMADEDHPSHAGTRLMFKPFENKELLRNINELLGL